MNYFLWDILVPDVAAVGLALAIGVGLGLLIRLIYKWTS